MKLFYKCLLTLFILLPVCLMHTGSYAQTLLGKTVTIDVKKQPLRDVLLMMGKQRDLSFSYNSNSIPNDSLVTLAAHNKTIQQVLDLLLGERCQYRETENHIIILPAEKEKWFTISGYLVDGITGEKVPEASVFEEQQLVATLSDAQGFFKLRIRDHDKYASARIRVSKGFYRDTVITTGQGYDQQLQITFNPEDYTLPGIEITPYASVERSWFGRHFFSSKLRKQSANLTRFFVDKPIQFSFVPGVGTHGKLSSQVTNKFSFNVLGGYTAGVEGFELGGLFNINKKDAKYVQIAGISNLVSGNAQGLQIGGMVNNVGGSSSGLQISGIVGRVKKNMNGLSIAGISGHVGGNMKGMQIAGIANFVRSKDTAQNNDKPAPDSVRGVQIAGIMNIAEANTEGVQVAGIVNLCRGNINGVQVSGIVNKARRLSGMQIGIINIADTVDGYALGFLNIVRKGYHKISIYSTESFAINAAYKAGNRKLYSVLSFSTAVAAGKKAYAYGYGIGNEASLGNRFALCSEVTANNVYMGSAEQSPIFIRLQSSLNFKTGKKVAMYAGPAFTLCPVVQTATAEGYASGIPKGALSPFKIGLRTAGWLGWQVGVSIF